MKGTYILVLFTRQNFSEQIGALGEIKFDKGFYCYVGSAMGKRGSTTLENRLKRHVKTSGNKSIHWHIDYLLESETILIYKIYILPNEKRLECKIAKEINRRADKIIKNFGSSDCSCPSHLYYFRQWNI